MRIILVLVALVLMFRTIEKFLGKVFTTKENNVGDLAKLLGDLTGLIASLQSQLIDTAKAAEDLAKMKYDEGFGKGTEEGKAQGFIDGVASRQAEVDDLKAQIEVLKANQGDPSKKYSQEELDKAVSDAVAPIQASLDAKSVELDGVKAEFETFKSGVQPMIDSAVEEAKKSVKEEIKAALDAFEAEKLG